jgi:hypothetical protein
MDSVSRSAPHKSGKNSVFGKNKQQLPPGKFAVA